MLYPQTLKIHIYPKNIHICSKDCFYVFILVCCLHSTCSILWVLILYILISNYLFDRFPIKCSLDSLLVVCFCTSVRTFLFTAVFIKHCFKELLFMFSFTVSFYRANSWLSLINWLQVQQLASTAAKVRYTSHYL